MLARAKLLITLSPAYNEFKYYEQIFCSEKNSFNWYQCFKRSDTTGTTYNKYIFIN